MQILKHHSDRVWQVAWHPSGNILASCGSDKVICIWKNINGKFELSEILDETHEKTIRCLSFSPDGKYLAAGSFDATISIWLIDDKFKLVQQLEGHENEVKSVSWSYDSKYLASCSRDKTVWIWDHSDEIEFQCNCVLQVHQQDVKCVKWSRNKSYKLWSCGYDDVIHEYDLIGEEWENDEDKKITSHNSIVWCIDQYQDILISVSSDLTIQIHQFNGENYLLTQTLQGYHDQPIYSCSFNFDGTLFAVASGDNKISIFYKSDQLDESGFVKYQFLSSKEFDEDINCVQFKPDSNVLAICGDDYQVRVIDLQL